MIELCLMTLIGFLVGVLAGYRHGKWEGEGFEQAWEIANDALREMGDLCGEYEQALHEISEMSDPHAMSDLGRGVLHTIKPYQQQ